jgi:uncharacterized repeat protein (TIGR03803 family)
MKRWYLGRFALSCALALALLAGCAADVNGSSPIGLSAVRTRSGSAYRVLYNFGSYPPDGEIPEAGLIKLNGVLYGTTINGGSGCYSSGGCGTVFAITTSGTETVLHSFSGGADGALPYAASRKSMARFTVRPPEARTSGTVYSVTTSGKESVLHRFQGIPDGADPQAALIDVSGSLYGTTTFGGAQQNRGTVFLITTSGQEKLLYRFVFKSQGGHRDGKYPESRLLNVNGTLYGTTYEGGEGNRVPSSRSRYRAAKACCTASKAQRPTARTHVRASSTPTARFTARPPAAATDYARGAETTSISVPFLRSRHPVRKS